VKEEGDQAAGQGSGNGPERGSAFRVGRRPETAVSSGVLRALGAGGTAEGSPASDQVSSTRSL